MPAGIKGTAEEGTAKEVVEDTIENSIVEGIAELIGRYPAIVTRVLIVEVTWDRAVIVGMAGADILVDEAGIPGYEVYINDATEFGAVLVAETPLAAP